MLVPIAIGSPDQRGPASSLRSNVAALVFTTILLSKSRPESRSRYVCVRRAKQ